MKRLYKIDRIAGLDRLPYYRECIPAFPDYFMKTAPHGPRCAGDEKLKIEDSVRAMLNSYGADKQDHLLGQEGASGNAPRARFRSWPLLVLAFGSLLLLMFGSDAVTMNRAAKLHQTVSEVNREYHHNAHHINRIRSNVQATSLLVRDYLIDPAPGRTNHYRGQMVKLRAGIDQSVEALRPRLEGEGRTKLSELQSEIAAYWRNLDPLFLWTPEHKKAHSFAFLQGRVMQPRREAVMRLAAEIEGLNEAALERQRSQIEDSKQAFNRFLLWMMVASILLGLSVAVFSVFRVHGLEARNEEHHRRTERAEVEMRRLSQELVRAQEDERKSISRELHDEVGQMLTGLRMEFRSLARMHGATYAEFEQRIEQGRVLLDQTLQAVRDIAMGLRPSMLDDLGLEAALQWQAREFCRRHDIPVTLNVNADLAHLPDRHRTNLYRIIQEALTNCARHAQARSITIDITEQNGTMKVTVADDGIGIESAEQVNGGLGLLGIQERVRELGGTARIESGRGAGTSLTLLLPAEWRVAHA